MVIKYISQKINNFDNNLCFDYLFYIVIFILILFLFTNKTEYNNKYTSDTQNINFKNIDSTNRNLVSLENFDSLEDLDNKQCSIQIEKSTSFYKKKYEEANNILKEKERQEFILNNYKKLSSNKENDNLFEIKYSLFSPKNIISNNDINKKIIIANDNDLNKILNETNKFKNIYLPGDVVSNPSSFEISKKDICYSNINIDDSIRKDPNFMSKHPECMVCSTNSVNFNDPNDIKDPLNSYLNTDAWKKTKTNIKSVCLFNNNNTKKDSTILSYNQCKSFCKL
jgi:hypothetical protein